VPEHADTVRNTIKVLAWEIVDHGWVLPNDLTNVDLTAK
jgi:hypothetical protein